MSGFVKYSFENAETLKAQSAQVVDRTAYALGFDTARKSLNISIRFALGASHQSWNSGSMTDSQQLAEWLVNGFHAGKQKTPVPGRPVFDNYMAYYGEQMQEICASVFRIYSHWSIRDRAYEAGKAVLRDFKRRIYTGSLAIASNSGDYAKRKSRKGYGDAPFVATSALLEDLEVVIE